MDDTLKTKKGICFDYAALMTAMLRSSGIPTRLDIGYATNIYHACISTYLDEQGWVDNVIKFDGKNWTMMIRLLQQEAAKEFRILLPIPQIII